MASCDHNHLPRIDDELELLAELLAEPLQRGIAIVELGCGNALLARALLQRLPGCCITALEVDATQHAKNLAVPQAALHRAIAGRGWDAVLERHFVTALRFRDFADFERRMVDVSFAERHLDPALRAAVRERFAPHCGSGGATFVRPMHARLLRRREG